MNSYYETFLRKDIFPHSQSAVDLIIDIYDTDEKERHYIYGVIETYIQGQISKYEAWRYLMSNVILKYKRQYECMGKYLDEEFKEKMR